MIICKGFGVKIYKCRGLEVLDRNKASTRWLSTHYWVFKITLTFKNYYHRLYNVWLCDSIGIGCDRWAVGFRKKSAIYCRNALGPIICAFIGIALKSLVKSLKIQKFHVYLEPRFNTSVGLQKPDVVSIRDDDQAAIIIDHTIIWDNGNLKWHSIDKENYYTNEDIFAQIWQLHHPISIIYVQGLVIGAHGVLGKCNEVLWRELGLPSLLKNDMVLITICGFHCCYWYCEWFGSF